VKHTDVVLDPLESKTLVLERIVAGCVIDVLVLELVEGKEPEDVEAILNGHHDNVVLLSQMSAIVQAPC
jgi:hypothetical protein